jgi:hypothetical protein
MALTSLAGTLLTAYCGLALGDRLLNWDAVAWAEPNGSWASWLCGAVTLFGLGFQIGLERRRARKLKEKAEEQAEYEHRRPRPQKSFWSFGQPSRRAG